jgi:Na+-transporting NADH:ubiquinone oxidoreductase subunit C
VKIDVKKQFRSLGAKAIDPADARFPLFVCTVENKTYYVVPMAGKGLWGPIWGYLAMEDDLHTIYGATFDHKTETPGLGAEINTASFQMQFPGKTIKENDTYVYIEVHKGGGGQSDAHGVDGITGGTITSNGLEDMITNTLTIYAPYFDQQNS